MYFGSVRFFKHLILTAILFAVISLTVSNVVLGVKTSMLEQQLVEITELAKNGGMTNPLSPLDPVDIEDKLNFEALSLEEEPQAPAGEPNQGGSTTDNPNAPAPNDGQSTTTSAPVGQKTPGSATGDGTSKVDIAANKSPYSRMYPYLKVAPITQYSADDNTVFLTFDDGPSRYTEDILKILEEQEVKATFFIITGADLDEDLVKKIYEQGHSVGIHTASHDYAKIYKSVEAYLEDANESFQKIYKITGEQPAIVRIPGGSNNPQNGFKTEIAQELARRGFTYFDWNISGEDYNGRADVDDIVANATRKPPRFNKYIALLHDGVFAKNTVEALPQIIAYYKNEGITFGKLVQSTKPIIFQ